MDMVHFFGVYLGRLEKRKGDRRCVFEAKETLFSSVGRIWPLLRAAASSVVTAGSTSQLSLVALFFFFFLSDPFINPTISNLFPTNTSKQQIQLPSTLALPFLFPPPLYSLHFLMPCFHPKKKSILSIHRTHFRPFSYLTV